MARSNGDLIAKARQMTEDVGRRPATVAEARAMLGVPAAAVAGMSGLPLEGVRVLDLSRLLPGGFCSLLLADFGADVLKVEDTGMGDYVRWSPPYYEGAEDSREVGAVPRAQPRQALDPHRTSRATAGREVLLRARARVRRRCSSPSAPACSTASASATSACARTTPALVYCAITGYGQDGPYRDRSGPRHELPRAGRAARA